MSGHVPPSSAAVAAAERQARTEIENISSMASSWVSDAQLTSLTIGVLNAAYAVQFPSPKPVATPPQVD